MIWTLIKKERKGREWHSSNNYYRFKINLNYDAVDKKWIMIFLVWEIFMLTGIDLVVYKEVKKFKYLDDRKEYINKLKSKQNKIYNKKNYNINSSNK